MEKEEIFKSLLNEPYYGVSDKGKEIIESISNLINHRDVIETLIFIIDDSSLGLDFKDLYKEIIKKYESDMRLIKKSLSLPMKGNSHQRDHELIETTLKLRMDEKMQQLNNN